MIKPFEHRSQWDQKIVGVDVLNRQSQKDGEQQSKMKNRNKNDGVEAIISHERSRYDHDIEVC